MRSTRFPLWPMTDVVTGKISYEDYEKSIQRLFYHFIDEMHCDYKMDHDQIWEMFQDVFRYHEKRRK